MSEKLIVRSKAQIHSSPQQELEDLMCPAIAKALRKYNHLNGSLPSRIIMYRYWIIPAEHFQYLHLKYKPDVLFPFLAMQMQMLCF